MLQVDFFWIFNYKNFLFYENASRAKGYIPQYAQELFIKYNGGGELIFLIALRIRLSSRGAAAAPSLQWKGVGIFDVMANDSIEYVGQFKFYLKQQQQNAIKIFEYKITWTTQKSVMYVSLIFNELWIHLFFGGWYPPTVHTQNSAFREIANKLYFPAIKHKNFVCQSFAIVSL